VKINNEFTKDTNPENYVAIYTKEELIEIEEEKEKLRQELKEKRKNVNSVIFEEKEEQQPPRKTARMQTTGRAPRIHAGPLVPRETARIQTSSMFHNTNNNNT